MKNVLTTIILFLGGLMAIVSCSDDSPGNIDSDNGSENDDTPITKVEKSRFIWIDAAGNFTEFANSKENIKRDLQKAKEAGFTDIVVDVRPSVGDVLFNNTTVADKLARIDVWEGSSYHYAERTANWDYLQAFIDAGHSLGLKVNASINTFTAGDLLLYGLAPGGLLYRDPSKKEWATVLNREEGRINTVDIAASYEKSDYGARFLNPANSEVQDYILSILKDLAKYNIDGIFLDRCRYDNLRGDFSDISKEKFEKYIGKTVDNFPGDVLPVGAKELPAKPAKYMKLWLEFRAKVIHDFIVKARSTIKTINPDIRLGVYVGAWYSSYYDVGVNWASPKYDTSSHYSWATADYKSYGYADHLDFMLIGAYAAADKIYGNTEWTVQGFCKLTKDLLQGDVKYAGGPDVGNGSGWDVGGKSTEVTNSVDAAINASDGYFIFDMCSVRSNNYWNALKKGIDTYKNSLESN